MICCSPTMAGGEVKLLGAWASPFVVRARMALGVKAAEYEFLEETLGSKSPLLLQSNPVYRTVPVLLHGDRAICESLIIVQYIDEVWASSGPGLLPSDPYDRALARFWAAYIDDKWVPSLRAFRRAEGDEARAACVEQLAAATQPLEEALEKCGKGGPFFGGEGVGYVDIALGSFLGSLRAAEKIIGETLLGPAKTPLLAAWADRLFAESAVKAALPDIDRLVELSKLMRAKMQQQAQQAAPPAAAQ